MIDFLLKHNLIPEFLLILTIKYLSNQRLKGQDLKSMEKNHQRLMDFVESLKKFPIALDPKKANEQHYELPYEFFELVLGKYKKYSCCYFDESTKSLDDAEKKMLEIYIERGQFQNGQNVLDLGCGWGSFTLFAAEKFPKSKFLAVSNSKIQKEYIEKCIKKRNLKNVRVLTKDINDFDIKEKFDRIISIEMFEHLRNYELLFKKIDKFLKKDGKLFVHIFVHREFTYFFEVKDETDWIAKYFFENGMMPSAHLFHYFQKDLIIENEWYVDGIHYYKTSLEWLKNLKKNKKQILEIFKNHYSDPDLWYTRWKIFFLTVAYFFKMNQGKEWFVAHYLFKKRN